MNKENINIENIYIIGGSPCSGKSTIAEMLRDEYGFYYFKADDYIEPFIKEMALSGNTLVQQELSMSTDEMWLRNPELQKEEEIQIYKDMFPLVLREINNIKSDKPIIAEGAAFMPSLMKEAQIPASRYICIAPSREFQLTEYAKRSWVNEYILADASDPEKAFAKWMERDILFAKEMLASASQFGYTTILTDGSKTIQENFDTVEQHFNLK